MKFTANDVILPGSSLSHTGGFLFSLGGLASGAKPCSKAVSPQKPFLV